MAVQQQHLSSFHFPSKSYPLQILLDKFFKQRHPSFVLCPLPKPTINKANPADAGVRGRGAAGETRRPAVQPERSVQSDRRLAHHEFQAGDRGAEIRHNADDAGQHEHARPGPDRYSSHCIRRFTIASKSFGKDMFLTLRNAATLCPLK